VCTVDFVLFALNDPLIKRIKDEPTLLMPNTANEDAVRSIGAVLENILQVGEEYLN